MKKHSRYFISCSNPANNSELKNSSIVIPKPSQSFLIVETVFAFACSNPYNEFSVCFNISEGYTLSGSDEITTSDKTVLNARTVQLQRVLKPGFPFIFEVSLVNTERLEDVVIYLLKDATKKEYRAIPLVEGK